MQDLTINLSEHALSDLNQVIANAKNEISCLKSIEDKLKELADRFEKKFSLPEVTSDKQKRYFKFSIDQKADNPITCAAVKTYWSVVKILIQHTAPSTYKELDNRGFAYIHYASYLGLEECVKNCLTEGVDINTRSTSGLTPLYEALIGFHEGTVKLLINVPGCDLETTHKDSPNDDETLLTKTAKIKNWDIARLIVEKLPISNHLDKRGYALIHYACYLGLKEKVQELLASGVDINLRSASGYTPLHQAIIGGHSEIVQFLMEQPGCDLEAQYLEEKKELKGPLQLAATEKKWEIARLIIGKLPFSNHLDTRGFALIHYGCYLGMFEKVKEFLKHSQDNNFMSSNGSPLFQAQLGLKDKPVEGGEYEKVIHHLKFLNSSNVSPKDLAFAKEFEDEMRKTAGLRRRRPFKTIVE